ncbi:MAG TPA: transketolase C-terminal domain-containing protein [Rectinemataceae bacterium]|nr:transketolase C-terminal domain-containing protein [Rectinemataceae bacterium]
MSQTGGSCRHAFSAALLDLARADKSIYALCSDSKGSAALGEFEAALPEQFVEAGIAEQDAIGIAAGLSRCGKTVFVAGPASFYAARSLDQVKVDVAYARSNVKVIGISGGVSYGYLGSTHHALHDIAVMRAFPDLEVFLPCDAVSTAAVTRYLATSGKPAYMRLGRGPVGDLYGPSVESRAGVSRGGVSRHAEPRSADSAPIPQGQSLELPSERERPRFLPGRANVLRQGDDCAIVAVGEMVQQAVAAADLLLAKGIRARVLDCWSMKPFDVAAIEAAARETRFIITIEEHSVHGGLGAAVAEVVVQSSPLPMRIMGFPDEWAPAGSSAELFDHYGLTARDIAAVAIDMAAAVH